MRSSVSDIDFARAYNSSATAAEVAQKTGLSSAAVNSRSANYRKKGMLLKRLAGRGPRAVDISAINQILRDEGLAPAESNGAPLPALQVPEGVLPEDQAIAKPKRKRKR